MESVSTTESVARHLRVYPDGAMILHYKTPDNGGLATAGLVPVEH